MKTVLIVALMCVNIVLLAALVADTATGQVAAQARGNYMMFTGKVADNLGAVYVVNLATNELAAWQFDPQTKRLIPQKKRSLAVDFRPSESPY